MTDGTGTTAWTFDAVGRPLTITQPSVGNVGYGYDSAGNRTRLGYPNGKVVTYTYDLASRLASATDWQAKTTTESYNAMGQPVTVALPNGVTSRYSYDNAGRVAVINHTILTQTLAVYTYIVDAVGNRTQVVESTLITATKNITTSHNSIASGALATNGSRGSVTAFVGGSAILAFTRIRPTLATVTIVYTYDPLYRLTAASYSTGLVYTYTSDAVGNRLSEGAPAGVTSYAYDDANRLATINGTINYTWDKNGNLTNNGQGSTYSYDAANRLTALSTSVYTYTYNGLGSRAQQASAAGPITYTLDQAAGLTQVLAESSGAAVTTYLYGQGRIAQQASGGTDYFLTDALGSVRQLTNASGNATLQKGYDPYGQTLSSSGTDSSNHDFTGEYKDPSALFYLRARYYTSRRGRFIQKDSVTGYKNPPSLNGWVYAYGNPTNYSDPSGHCIDSNGNIRLLEWPWGWWRFCAENTTTSTNDNTTVLPTPTAAAGARSLFPSSAQLLAGYSEAQILGVHQTQPNGSACFPTSAAMAINLLVPGANIKSSEADSGIRVGPQQAKGIGVPSQLQETSLSSFLVSQGLGNVVEARYHDFQDSGYGSARDASALSYLKDNVDEGVITIVSVSWGTDLDLQSIRDTAKNGVGHAMVLVGYDNSSDKLYFLDPGLSTSSSSIPLEQAGIRQYVDGEFLSIWLDQPNRFIQSGTSIALTTR